MKIPSVRLLSVAVFFVAAQIAHGQSTILNRNLIVNGNAESGPASPDGKTVVPSIPGWTVAAQANVVPYNLAGAVQLSDPASPDHGFQYFAAGGPHGSTSILTQDIDVAAAASTISGGNVKYTVSAYLGTAVVANPSQGTAGLAVAFKNGSGQTFSTVNIGPLPFHKVGMSLQQEIGLVPAGTVRITVTLGLSTFNGAHGAADSLSLVLTTFGTNASAVLGANLLVNGDAESGPGVPPTSTAPYVPGWSTRDGASVAPFGGPGWIAASDPGPPNRGVNLFCGAYFLEAGSMYQDIDVSAAASLIDAGQATYQVSAWLGGLRGYESPTMTYVFFDWTGKQLAATGQLGPVTHSGTGLVPASNSGTLPAGTRRVNVALGFGGAEYMADNISFSLSSNGVANAVLPQLAFGGGWYSALYFTNLNNGPVSFTVNFIGDNGQPLTVPSLNGSSATVSLAARGSALVEAPNVGSLVTGYVTAALPMGVTGYGIFRQSVPGVPDQEAVVPLSGVTATTNALVFDDTSYVTGVAVVNLSSAPTSVAVTAYDAQGNTIGTSSISLAGNAHMSFALRNLPGLAGVAGKQGSADFTVASGNIAVLGLRFNGAAFTSIPAAGR